MFSSQADVAAFLEKHGAEAIKGRVTKSTKMLHSIKRNIIGHNIFDRSIFTMLRNTLS